MATRSWWSKASIAFLLFAPCASGQTSPPAKAPPPPAKGDDRKGDESKSSGKVGETIPEWKGKVVRGDKSVEFETTKNGKPTVYVLVGSSCPATAQYADRLAALDGAYEGRGVDFVFVYPNSNEPAAAKQKFHREHHFAAALLNDDNAAFAKSLGADHTGLALLVDKSGKVVYRGGVDDNLSLPKVKSKHLAQALDQLLKDQAVASPSNKDVFGAPIK